MFGSGVLVEYELVPPGAGQKISNLYLLEVIALASKQDQTCSHLTASITPDRCGGSRADAVNL